MYNAFEVSIHLEVYRHLEVYNEFEVYRHLEVHNEFEVYRHLELFLLAFGVYREVCRKALWGVRTPRAFYLFFPPSQGEFGPSFAPLYLFLFSFLLLLRWQVYFSRGLRCTYTRTPQAPIGRRQLKGPFREFLRQV